MRTGAEAEVTTAMGLGAVALLLHAAWTDARRRVILHRSVLGLAALWLLAASQGAISSLPGGLSAALICFVLGTGLWSLGGFGGGDVKLLSAAGLWAGLDQLPALLVLTALCGGVLALFVLLHRVARPALVAARYPGARLPHEVAADPEGSDRRFTATSRHHDSGPGVQNEEGIPYGIAISAAAILIMAPALASTGS